MTTETLKVITGSELGLQMRKGAKPEVAKVEPVSIMDHRSKPFGGVWTSSLTEEGSSDWERWCVEQNFRTDRDDMSWTLKPSDDVVLLHVESRADVAALEECFGKQGLFGVELDWEAMAKEFDGLSLSNPWVGDTFYGWDCESTLFFRWSFEEVTEGV